MQRTNQNVDWTEFSYAEELARFTGQNYISNLINLYKMVKYYRL